MHTTHVAWCQEISTLSQSSPNLDSPNMRWFRDVSQISFLFEGNSKYFVSLWNWPSLQITPSYQERHPGVIPRLPPWQICVKKSIKTENVKCFEVASCRAGGALYQCSNEPIEKVDWCCTRAKKLMCWLWTDYKWCARQIHAGANNLGKKGGDGFPTESNVKSGSIGHGLWQWITSLK